MLIITTEYDIFDENFDCLNPTVQISSYLFSFSTLTIEGI